MIQRLCGSTQDNETIVFESQGSSLYVIFKSDISRTGKGLQFGLKIRWSRCGDSIMDASNRGVITSPRYPNPNPEGAYCIWILFAPPGRGIKITFLEHNLKIDPRNSSNCIDKLYVRLNEQFDGNLIILLICVTVVQGKPVLTPNTIFMRSNTTTTYSTRKSHSGSTLTVSRIGHKRGIQIGV